MYIITKKFSFDAAHQLDKLPKSHKCSRLHGHTYTVTFELRAIELNKFSFVMDYGDLQPVKEFIDSTVDHRFLNEIFHPKATTAENIAKWFYDIFKKQYPMLYSVTVQETPNTSALYME